MTTEPDQLAVAFSQARPRLVRVAYAIIGSHGEAEDVVADCWFRLTAADEAETVRDVEAWAVVTVSRMALDVLRSARVGASATSARGCPSQWSRHPTRRARTRPTR